MEGDDGREREGRVRRQTAGRTTAQSKGPPPTASPVGDPGLVEPGRRGSRPDRAGSHGATVSACRSQSALSLGQARERVAPPRPAPAPRTSRRGTVLVRRRASVDRQAGVGRSRKQEQRRQGDEPVVVEVRRDVEQLDPGEPARRRRRSRRRASGGHRQRGRPPPRREAASTPPRTGFRDPPEAEVGEVQRRAGDRWLPSRGPTRPDVETRPTMPDRDPDDRKGGAVHAASEPIHEGSGCWRRGRVAHQHGPSVANPDRGLRHALDE